MPDPGLSAAAHAEVKRCLVAVCTNHRAWDGLCAVHLELIEAEQQRDALSLMLRGMARRASGLRQVAAVQAELDLGPMVDVAREWAELPLSVSAYASENRARALRKLRRALDGEA